MNKKVANIVIVDTSEIIYQGLFNILTNTGQTFSINQAENLTELEQHNLRNKADLVIINPLLIQNQTREFQSLKKEFCGTHWIALVYSFIDPQMLSGFDEIVNISDKTDKIIASVHRLLITSTQTDDSQPPQETLSEREIDVLKLLVAGNANKEIADKLNISTHTVISHRKNISQKTGIKSVSGLTIYAVVKNIITIDSYRE